MSEHHAFPERHRAAEERSSRLALSQSVGWPVIVAVAARPRLWPAAIVQVRRLARPGWWHRWPPVPAPDPDWLRFRARTAYGDPDHRPEPADVVAWLEWCRHER